VEQNTFNRILLILLASVFVIGTVVFVYYNFSQKPQESFYQSLLGKNESFAYAEGLLKSGKYSEAADHYRLALAEAEGYKEEGQLKYKIAISLGEGNNPLAAVPLLKEIIANENYTPTIRAYSVQQIGHFLYSYNSEELKNEVFKDEPYRSFIADGDYFAARRKLFEYGSSIYPLGIPELRIAKWYSEEILRLQKLDGDENTQKTDEMKDIVRQKIANADRYLTSIVTDEQARSYVAEVLYRKANVQADLYLTGDKNLGDPEETYRKSLTIATLRVGQESSAKMYYAMYLARMYGEERSEDIKNILKDFYVGNKYASTNTVRSIKGEKDGKLGLKSDILLLARIDTSFGEFLKSLGWKL